MKNKAQSILEYVVVLGVITMALTTMQLYFKRSIQAVVKVAADEMGEQKKGAVDYDYRYEWKKKGDSEVSTFTTGNKTTQLSNGGAVEYGRDETTTQKGVLSEGIQAEKE